VSLFPHQVELTNVIALPHIILVIIGSLYFLYKAVPTLF